jgi:hypothetical protein
MKKGFSFGSEARLEQMTRGAVVVSSGLDGSCVLRLRNGRLVRVSRLPAWRGWLGVLLSRAMVLLFPRTGAGGPPVVFGPVLVRSIGRNPAGKPVRHTPNLGDCERNAAGF